MAEKKKQHRRVTTMTTFTYGILELRIIEAKSLKPTGKRCDSFVRVSAGAHSFVSEVFKKTVAPAYNWTIPDIHLDRDDVIDIRIYDKYEIDKYDVPVDVEPLGKLKFSVASITGDQGEPRWVAMQGQHKAELQLSCHLVEQPISTSAVFTKGFAYPTFTSESARLGFVKAMDFEEFKIGVSTLARYCLKWYRSTRGIAGMDAKVLDISLSHSDNAILLTTTFCYQPMATATTASADAAVPAATAAPAPPPPASAAPPPPRSSNDDDDADGANDDEDNFLNVLQYRLFHAPMEKLKDKKKISSNGRDAHEYKHAFRASSQGLFELRTEANTFITENVQDLSRLFCVNTCQSDVSHHVIVWFFR